MNGNYSSSPAEESALFKGGGDTAAADNRGLQADSRRLALTRPGRG
jgi:hypothetical protein